MQNDPGAEWTRLMRLYQDKSDEELLALEEDFGNLTEIAQGVLRDEVRKRKLELANSSEKASGGASERRVNGERQPRRIFGAWNNIDAAGEASTAENRCDERGAPIPFVYLCECDSSDQVNQLEEVLRRSGIESKVEGISYRPVAAFETCRLTVPADQLDAARDIIAQPIPQDIVDEVRQPVEDFGPPTCPKCGADDPLLESVDPTNTWLCENCGVRWTDPAPVENEGPNPA